MPWSSASTNNLNHRFSQVDLDREDYYYPKIDVRRGGVRRINGSRVRRLYFKMLGSLWGNRVRVFTVIGLVTLIWTLWGYGKVDHVREEGKGLWSTHVLPKGNQGIHNSTLGFQKLFIINMPARTDRRDACTLAAAIEGMDVDFVDGVGGDSILEASLPPEGSSAALKLGKGIKGSWRSHMNALQIVVKQNLTTALIFEDDVDWDIRLRQQLHDFAVASRFLTSPAGATKLSKLDIKEIHNSETEDSIHNGTSPNPISPFLQSLALPSISTKTPPEHDSPYGSPEDWDLLWLGHCGAGFPRFPSTSSKIGLHSIVVQKNNDVTVPLPKYVKAHPFGPPDPLGSSHAPHTRVYHRASGGALCTVAYAVSQRGARRLLHEFSVKGWSKIFDLQLGEWCAGKDKSGGEKAERRCITVQPPIFAHHHPPAGASDIGGVGGGYATNVETKYVRFSVRMNLEALVRGERMEEMVDQWPD